MLGLRSGFAAIDLDSGRRTPIEDPEHHLPDNRFNDGKCDPAGRFWAGTMDTREELAPAPCVLPGRELRVPRKVPGVSISNGLAWSADGTTMYCVDSPTRHIVAYDYDVATGAIENPRPVFHVPEGAGFPDGMAIDVDGCLWVALWDGRRVLRVDPVSGDIADHIDMPVSRPTSCAFGGSAFDELFITSASNLPPHQLAREPHAGGVFRVRPGVKVPRRTFRRDGAAAGVVGRSTAERIRLA